jgi:hypothetical protein
MIQITSIKENGTIRPSRELTAIEKQSVVYVAFDGTKYNYYQKGDELPILDLGEITE